MGNYLSILLLLPITLGVVITYVVYRSRDVTTDSFFVANRNVVGTVASIVLAAAWVWATALFVIPEKAYVFGIVAYIPFVIGNAAGLVLLGSLVPRVREFCDNLQLTLPQFTEIRDGKKTAVIFAIAVFGISIYSVILHQVATKEIVRFFTKAGSIESGAIDPQLVFGLALAFLIVAGTRGLESSLIMDCIKFTAIGGIVTCTYLAIRNAGGTTALVDGLAGTRPPEQLFRVDTLFWLILPNTIGFLAAASMDDQLYQRGFAARHNPRRAYYVAAVLFLGIAGSVGCLGLLGANASLAIPVVPKTDDFKIVNLLTIQALLPEAVNLMVALLLVAFVASGGAALHIAGNVVAKNLVQMVNPNVQDRQLVFVSRITMLVALSIGTAVSLVNIGIYQVWFTMAMFRSVLFIPLVALIWTKKEHLPSVFSWIVIGFPITISTWMLFWLQKDLDPIGKAILAGFATGLIMWAWHAFFAKKNGDAIQPA